ncbi:hemerythrin domain-containing protein [Variovorax paradoxus]|nr:hemerythrin domain-containing protein [Variovorax paradoxus]
MLAAECAWAVLGAEHARIRELLALVERALDAGDWTDPAPQAAASLVELIERLQAFEETTHRPKGVVLLKLLRGRSAEADQLLDQLELESAHCDDLLSRSKAMLKRAGAGETDAAAGADTLLQEHRRVMHAHLEQEDTLLHSQAALLLTGEEWAAVASSISEALRPRKKAPAGASSS